MISSSLSKKSIIKFTIIFVCFAAVICLLALILSLIKKESSFLYFVSVFSSVSGIISILTGWIVGNRITYQYRRESKNFNGALPIEILNKKLDMRSPFIVNGLLLILIYSVIELVVTLI